MRCGRCQTKLQSNYIYVNRKRINAGLFCPLCLIQGTVSKELQDYEIQLIKEQKVRAKAKPKFKRERKACPYCMDNGRVNRSKWTIRKMKVKPSESKSWKCTCKICGRVWTQNTGEEYYYYDANAPKPSEMMGAPM